MNIIKQFYSLLPFNKSSDVILLEEISKSGTPWPELDKQLDLCETAIELGSGSGWLSNRISNNWNNLSIIGLDLLESNVETANGLASPNSKFYCEDITTFTRSADLVISVGVLHHIPGFEIIDLMAAAVRSGNRAAFIGLYHLESRRAMFDFFNNYPENKRYNLFCKMTPWFKDDQQRQSWWRDQFFHPYEVSVTIGDYKKVEDMTGYKLTWLSQPTDDVYTYTMERLYRYEFTSGFIYGIFESNL
jgi:cyclopropane fatty-acyl-phospholipid synthase-like methyltransferase